MQFIDSTAYLSAGTMRDALERRVAEHQGKGFTKAENNSPHTRKVYLEGDGFVEVKVMEKLFLMCRFSGEIIRLFVGVIEYDAI